MTQPVNLTAVGTGIALLFLAGLAFAETDTEARAASRHIVNDIKQQLFVARPVEIHTTQHRRFMWSMTFERVSDGEPFGYGVWDDSPIASALGFREWKRGKRA